MDKDNIINFSDYNPQKKHHPFQDNKLFCFYDLFKKRGIDLKKINFVNYTRPINQKHSIIGAIVSKEPIDLKQNFIFNFLDNIKYYYESKCNEPLDLTRCLRADYIFLNIASELFEHKFSNRNLDSSNRQDIIDTLKYLNIDDYNFKTLAVIYCAYLNGDIKTCKMINDLYLNEPIKFSEFQHNIRLLSKNFIDSLPIEGYHYILNIITTDSYCHPEFKDTFYQYAKEIWKMNPDFFKLFDYGSFLLFFLKNSQTIIDLFGIDRIVKMNIEELNLISNDNYSKEELIEIKQFMDLKVPTPKIEKLICYPTIIRLGYQKITFIKNKLCDKEKSEQEVVLSKKI